MAHNRRGFLTMFGALASMSSLTPKVLFSQQTRESASEYMLEEDAVFLNTGTLGLTPRPVLERVVEVWQELEENPVSTVYGNSRIHALPDQVRALAAQSLGCSTDELMITRSTSEAMNTIAEGMKLAEGDHVLTTDQEHEGGSDCWKYLARRRGIVIDVMRITPADLDMKALVDRFASAITARTKVISVSHVLCTTGLRMPVTSLANLANHYEIKLVIDGAQAVGGMEVNVKEIGCHAYAAAGHKWLLGPKGTGLLYISKDKQDAIAPISWQGGQTYIAGATGVGSIPLVAGLGRAIELMQSRGFADVERHNTGLRNRLYSGLQHIPKARIMSAPPGPLATALIGVAIPDHIDPQKFAFTLHDQYKVTVRTATKEWYNGIRLSPHVYNTDEHIDRALNAIRTELAL
jgi:selenocysteine lyase/cysteine desulfurase